MDYNTQPSSHENENNSNPNNNYTQWQKTMEDVKFKNEVTPHRLNKPGNCRVAKQSRKPRE